MREYGRTHEEDANSNQELNTLNVSLAHFALRLLLIYMWFGLRSLDFLFLPPSVLAYLICLCFGICLEEQKRGWVQLGARERQRGRLASSKGIRMNSIHPISLSSLHLPLLSASLPSFSRTTPHFRSFYAGRTHKISASLPSLFPPLFTYVLNP